MAGKLPETFFPGKGKESKKIAQKQASSSLTDQEREERLRGASGRGLN